MHDDLSSTLSAIDALSAPSSSSSANTQDNGVWLIVIVFGYIFGLFLIFVIIWFIWYGTSLKRKHHYGHGSSANLHQHLTNETPFRGMQSSSGHQFSQYDYSTHSSLNRPSHNMGFGQLNNDSESYSPIGLKANPAFSTKDESTMFNSNNNSQVQNSISLNGNLINSSSSNIQNKSNQLPQSQQIQIQPNNSQFQPTDELSSSHSMSFVHSYQHRI